MHSTKHRGAVSRGAHHSNPSPASLGCSVGRVLAAPSPHADGMLQAKKDMQAAKALRGAMCPANRIGHIPGVPVGTLFKGRGEACIAGIHQAMMQGIDSK